MPTNSDESAVEQCEYLAILQADSSEEAERLKDLCEDAR